MLKNFVNTFKTQMLEQKLKQKLSQFEKEQLHVYLDTENKRTIFFYF